MTLLDRIRAHAGRSPSRPAYIYSNGCRTTYGELDREIAVRRGTFLRRVRRRGIVIVNFGNTGGFPATFLAALSAGLDAFVLHESTSPREVAATAARVGAVLVVTPHERTMMDLPASIPTLAGDELHGNGERHAAVVTNGAVLLPTSGSTGRSKIVRRSAASLDAVAANTVESVGFTPADRVLATVPLAHSYGLEHGLLAPLWAGATVVLCDGLDLPQLVTAIGAGITIVPAVPSILERLADASESFDGLANVRTIYSAGAPLPDAVRDRFTRRFGTPVGQLYGSTEVGTVAYRRGDTHSGVGLPMRGVSIRILDGDAVAIRSPSMFDGYLDGPAELVDGHFLTGDLGHLAADGSLVLTGRSKLLIDAGGFKVNPLEVEAVLRGHADVADVVVVPLPQSETVCRLRAVVVPRDRALPPTVESLRAFARTRLAPHKVPRAFTFRDSLPRSATGKVLRPMLDAE